MKRLTGKVIPLILLLLLASIQLTANNLKGVIIDKTSKEPLVGATVQVVGTNTGVVTDFDGNFTLSVPGMEKCKIEIKYISYKTLLIENTSFTTGQSPLVIELEPDNLMLEDVTIVARKNLEGDKALLQERQKAVFAIENIGAKEMSLKGISNVSDGVKKLTGISIASAGQLVVRGLGDRYSITTLNGLPIASSNPDHKLIPLDLFPSSTVKNITVSKVYQPATFGDYSGAHVDISTKEHTGQDFFLLSVDAGGNANTLFKDFYHSDRKGSLFSNNTLDRKVLDMSKSEFDGYIRNNDPFGTGFSVSRKTSLPEMGISAGAGKNWQIGEHKLSLLASAGLSNEQQIIKDAFVTTLTAQGTNLNHFDYDSYTSKLKVAALASVGYSFRKADHINYTFFYARNAIDNYMYREGYDSEKVDLIGSNSVFHAYSLLNNQLLGYHEIGKRWEINWSGSYGITTSDEPDRRQVMFRKDDGKISLFKLNQQETMRYFGDLDEKEWVGNLKLNYNFGKQNQLQFGVVYKDKSRDFNSVRFYYNLNSLNPEITDIYNTDDYLNTENIANGSLVVSRVKQKMYSYYAGNEIWAAFFDVQYYPVSDLLVSIGARYERSQQWVRYWKESSAERRSELNKDDFFPAVNVKYGITERQSLRFSASRTVTRPSFIEMAPFLYKASYGGAEIRGNENLQNGYNYNVDLRYEIFSSDNEDMLSITGYYKKLQSPIERVQESSGGAAVHSFRNASDGMAAGIEVEARKKLFNDFRVGLNASYMYTNVNLPEGEGVYTDSERQLQGASPYLANADVSYTPGLGKDRRLLLALIYNLQGPRINTVGIYQAGNIKQQTLHTLDFTGGFEFNSRLSTKIKVKNLLNSTVNFKQDIPQINETILVESFKLGFSAEIGITYKF